MKCVLEWVKRDIGDFIFPSEKQRFKKLNFYEKTGKGI
jgi:hypothetical protein